MRRPAPPPFLTRAHDVEERVVDTDSHPDQDEHRPHAGVDRDCLADRAQQSERCSDSSQGEEDRNRCRDGCAEGEQEHEQRYRHGQNLGTLQVVVHGLVPGVAGGDLARFFDGHTGMSACRGEDLLADRLRVGAGECHYDDRRMAVARDELLSAGIERALDLHLLAVEARDDIVDRAAKGRIPDRQRVAVQIRDLVRRRPQVVRVEHVVAPGRLPDRAVLQRLRSGRDHRGDREHDEGEPHDDCAPGVACAPASDRRYGSRGASVAQPSLCFNSDSSSWARSRERRPEQTLALRSFSIESTSEARG